MTVRWALALGLLTSRASADTALEARARAEADKTWLELDLTTRPPVLEGLGARHQLTRDTIALGRHTTLLLELDQWSNEDGALPSLDLRGQGFTSSVRLVRNLGFATLTLHGAYADVDTPAGRGRYDELGISLLRTHDRGAGKRVWYGVTLGRRTWHGDEPPAGEKNVQQLLFVLGWNF